MATQKTPTEQLGGIADSLYNLRRRFKAAGDKGTAKFCSDTATEIEAEVDKLNEPEGGERAAEKIPNTDAARQANKVTHRQA